jgi:hypothetical protein
MSVSEKIYIRNNSTKPKTFISEDGRTKILMPPEGTAVISGNELAREGGFKLNKGWITDEHYDPGGKHDPRKGKVRGGK